MSFQYSQVSSTDNIDGSTTVEAQATFTTSAFAPPVQTGAALVNTTLFYPVPTLPFPGSIFNTAIGGSPTLDVNSAAIVSNLVAQWSDIAVGLNNIQAMAHVGGFGAYYLSSGDQPTVPIFITGLPLDSASNQIFSQVPIPPQAEGSASLCSTLGVWQPSTHQIWEFSQPAYEDDAGWSAQYGALLDDRGTGIDSPGLYPSSSGISLWALAIKVAELQQGQINHALALYLPYIGPGHVAPAVNDNGLSLDARSILTGIRFQLIPGTNVSALSATGQIVAQALMTYGAFVVDTNPYGLSILFEDPGQYDEDPYETLFPSGDLDVLDNMPVSSFRVIAHP